MPAPSLDFIETTVDLLARNLEILPTVGGAVEELLQPDVDEIEEMLANADSREVTEFLEYPTPYPRNGIPSGPVPVDRSC